MESPEHERQQVVDYTQSQAADEIVEHAERIASEHVFSRRYDVWDVHTDRHRWWVVINPTNLYSRADFKSMDGVLSFHIGLMARVMARDARKAPSRPEPRLERTRRQWEQAADAQNAADEAEEFQAVGMRCRETLLSFTHAMASDQLVPKDAERPKDSDFIHWVELVADAAVPGSHNSALRSYLKAVAKRAWDYLSWLTHAKNATRIDGDIAVEVTAHFLSLFEQVIERQEMGVPDRCPSCASYRLGTDWRMDEDDGQIIQAQVCEACGWYQELAPEPLHRPADEPGDARNAVGDCLPSSDL